MSPNLLNHINRGKSAVVEGQNFFYREEGKGEEIVILLHGFLTTSYNYRYVLEELSKNYRVIAPDFLGIGLSSRPDTPLSHRMMAFYLYHFLEEVTADKKVHVVCFDYALPIMSFLLKDHPEKIKTVSILNGFLHLPKFRFYFPLHFLRLPLLGDLFSFLFRPPFLNLFYKLFLVKKDFVFPKDWDKDMFHLLFQGKTRNNTLEFIRNVDRSTHALREIEEGAKALVGLRQIFIGSEDYRISPFQTEYIKETMRTSSLNVLPCKHLPMEECSKEVSEKIHYFIDSFSHKKTKKFNFHKQNKE